MHENTIFVSNFFQDSETDSGEISYRRQQILKYGRQSRHNVISRRDNLILSPDKPPTVQVTFWWRHAHFENPYFMLH